MDSQKAFQGQTAIPEKLYTHQVMLATNSLDGFL
jgi:hypothetical protein